MKKPMKKLIERPEVTALTTNMGELSTIATEAKGLFLPMFEKMEDLEERANDLNSQPISREVCELARIGARESQKVRTGTAKIHKDAKNFYNRVGKLMDSWKNLQLLIGTPIEEQFKSIATHYERIEKEKKEALKEARTAELMPYLESPSDLPANIETLSVKAYDMILKGAISAHDERIEAERIETERIAAEKLEQQKRAKEAEDKRRKELRAAKAAKAEADKVAKVKESRVRELMPYLENYNRIPEDIGTMQDAAYKDILTAAKAEHQQRADKAEVDRKEAARIQKKKDDKAKADKAEKARLRKIIDDKVKADKAEKARIEKEKQAELSKGDREKAKDLLQDLAALQSKYSFESVDYNGMHAEVNEAIVDAISIVSEVINRGTL
ncbi:MAG: hypothetical protein GY853_14535 [PVC group bacterium]|nr:hypothetical protein [PVC group bacterium]